MALSAMIPRMLFTLHSIPRRQSAHVFVSSQRTRDSSPRLSAVLLSSPLLSSPPRTPRRLLLSPPFLIFPCFDVRHAISFHSRTPVTRAFFPSPRLSIIGLLFPRLSIFRPPLYSIVVILRAERTYE